MASTSRKRKEIKRQEIRRQDDKRQAIVAARSKFAASERTRLHMGKGAALPSPTWFYIAGVTLALCGVVELACLCVVGLEGKSFSTNYPRLSGYLTHVGAPGVLFLLAGSRLFSC